MGEASIFTTNDQLFSAEVITVPLISAKLIPRDMSILQLFSNQGTITLRTNITIQEFQATGNLLLESGHVLSTVNDIQLFDGNHKFLGNIISEADVVLKEGATISGSGRILADVKLDGENTCRIHPDPVAPGGDFLYFERLVFFGNNATFTATLNSLGDYSQLDVGSCLIADNENEYLVLDLDTDQLVGSTGDLFFPLNAGDAVPQINDANGMELEEAQLLTSTGGSFTVSFLDVSPNSSLMEHQSFSLRLVLPSVTPSVTPSTTPTETPSNSLSNTPTSSGSDISIPSSTLIMSPSNSISREAATVSGSESPIRIPEPPIPASGTPNAAPSTSSSKSRSNVVAFPSLSPSPNTLPTSAGSAISSCSSCQFGTSSTTLNPGGSQSGVNQETVIGLNVPGTENQVGIIIVPPDLIVGSSDLLLSVSYVSNNKPSPRVPPVIIDITLLDAQGNQITQLDNPLTVCVSGLSESVCVCLLLFTFILM